MACKRIDKFEIRFIISARLDTQEKRGEIIVACAVNGNYQVARSVRIDRVAVVTLVEA